MIRRPPRSTLSSSSAASDVYKRQARGGEGLMLQEIILAGFGGQGVMSMGKLLAYAGLEEDKNVSWIPSYGPEMRGGTANCSVTISDVEVSSPIITEPDTLIVLLSLIHISEPTRL